MTMMRDNNLDIPRVSAPAQDIVPASPTTAWQIIEEACDARVTGEVTLTTESPVKTRVYMSNGLVYFAERDSDTSLAARLVEGGAIDAEQLKRGSVRLSGVEHLGRLFDRDPSIDRDSVEVVIELITEDTLTEIADKIVRSYRTAMFRHHPSGIARWFSSMQAAEESIPEPTPAVAVRHMSAVPDLIEDEPARPLAPVFDIVPQSPASIDVPAAPVQLSVGVEPDVAVAAASEPVDVEPEVVEAGAAGPEVVEPEVVEPEVVPSDTQASPIDTAVAVVPDTSPESSPAAVTTPSWSSNGGDDAVLQALNALEALQPMMPLPALIPITPVQPPVAPIAAAPADPDAFDMTSLLQNLDAYGVNASSTRVAPVVPDRDPATLEPAADEPRPQMTHVDEHPFDGAAPIVEVEPEAPTSEQVDIDESTTDEVTTDEPAIAEVEPEAVATDEFTVESPVHAPVDDEVGADLPMHAPRHDAEPIAEQRSPWMQPTAPEPATTDAPVSQPAAWWHAPAAIAATAPENAPEPEAAILDAPLEIEPTSYDSATTDLFGSFRLLVAAEPDGLEHFVVPQVDGPIGRQELTPIEAPIEAPAELVQSSAIEVADEAELTEPVVGDVQVEDVQVEDVHVEDVQVEDVHVEQQVEQHIEDVQVDEAASLETMAERQAPPAPAPAPILMPTLPTFSSPPNMRISAQAPPPRTLPSVMTNSRPELTLNADGPRLPSPTRPGQPEPVLAEPARAEMASVEMAELVAAVQTSQPATAATPTAIAPTNHETPDIDWVTELASTAQPIAAPVPFATELAQMTQLASLTPAAAPTAFVPLDSPAPRFAGLTQLTSIGDIATEARRAVDAQPTAEIAAHVSPFAQLTAMTSITSMTSTAPPAFLDAPLHASLPTTAAPLPNLDSIPVPEDVAAAVRRAITAIEAATLAPSGGSAIAFGPMHVTSPGQVGRPMTFDSLLNPAGVASGASFDALGMNTGQLQMGGNGSFNPLSEEPVPPQLLSNVPPAALSSERRGALRRLIDGIRRRN